MEEIVIQDATDVSWQAYRDLRLQALQEEPQAFASSYEDERQVNDSMWQERLKLYHKGKHNWMFFASINNELVGMVGAYQTKENFEENEAYVMAMFVKKEARGKKIAKRLMLRLIDALSEVPTIKRVKLGVGLHQTSALALYESVGFQVIEKEHVKLGDGEFYDEYVMQKELRP